MRIRPIILTSVTTIMGLLPMAVGIGGKSVVWAPLANTIIWGLVFSTFLTLFIVPCFYTYLGDIKKWLLGASSLTQKRIDIENHVMINEGIYRDR